MENGRQSQNWDAWLLLGDLLPVCLFLVDGFSTFFFVFFSGGCGALLKVFPVFLRKPKDGETLMIKRVTFLAKRKAFGSEG